MEIKTITATLSDGSTLILFPVGTPVVTTVDEVDVKLSDGTDEVLVPKV